MTEREALKLALENICAAKLCEFNSMSSRHEMIRLMDNTITTIKEVLAQPENKLDPVHEYRKGFIAGQIDMRDRLEEQEEHEPVAWRYVPSDVWGDAIVTQDQKTVELAQRYGRPVEPLYTTPPQRTWVGLTWEDANEIAIEHDVRPSTVKAIETKLKEKNGGNT